MDHNQQADRLANMPLRPNESQAARNDAVARLREGLKPLKNTPTTYVYHCNCSSVPCTCHQRTSHPDDLLHIEVDPQGRTHIWPYDSYMRNKDYHPEWRDEQTNDAQEGQK